MKFSTSLILIAGLAFATSSYADHERGNSQFEARYYYSSGNAHNRHGDKHYRHANKHYREHHTYYVRDDHHDHYDDHYYVRHVHSRDCGHHYEPAYNTRVKVFLGI